MKFRYLIIGLWLGGLLAAVPHPVRAAAESVSRLEVVAQLNQTGSLDITETIDYDFAGNAPHDITHTIPLSYYDDQGRKFLIGLKWLGAQRNGQFTSFTPTVDESIARVNLPAGTAPYHYELRYTLSAVVLHGVTNDIFKLNATGLNWSAPIAQAVLTFRSPGLASDNFTCFTGSGGSTSGACTITQEDDTVSVVTTTPLGIGEALTVYCNYPHNAFANYLEPYQHPQSWLGFWIFGVTALAAVIGGVVWLVRRRPIVTRRPPDYTKDQ